VKQICRTILFAACATALVGCGGSSSEPSSNATPAPIPAPTQARTASLQWDGVSASDLAGYRVYFGTTPGSYAQARGQGIDAGNKTSVTVSNLQAGSTYYFVVTSYDFAGNESGYSNEVSRQVN
jgi:fibronectin type 3 domain-containing protein